MRERDLPEQDARLLTADRHLADLFENACRIYPQPRKIFNLISGPFLRLLHERDLTPADSPVRAEALAELARIVDEGLISAKIAGDIFPDLCDGQAMPDAVVRGRGLAQVSDADAIERTVAAVLAENPAEVAAYRGGKTKLMGFFVGKVMRAMRGQANPAVLGEILARKLGE
jgi:aspartyl-tRNA(Asn)/glutamyl-tRNA(Gln) amidotransferase subunit B